jgi:hypothetical protein
VLKDAKEEAKVPLDQPAAPTGAMPNFSGLNNCSINSSFNICYF